MVRKRIYQIIEVASEEDLQSRIYDLFMMTTIVISLAPLMFKDSHWFFNVIDYITAAVFVVDYILRWLTADFKMGKRTKSFILYPFTLMAIIDLLSILPSITIVSGAFKVLKVFRLFRTFRVFRVFKAFRYSKNISIILRVFQKQKESLTVVCWLAGGYILISALIMFNVEPDTFNSFFEAIYWATVSLTTVGYGDIYATSTIGKIITMCSSILGIAIVALPSGIITAGYLDEIKNNNKQDE